MNNEVPRGIIRKIGIDDYGVFSDDSVIVAVRSVVVEA